MTRKAFQLTRRAALKSTAVAWAALAIGGSAASWLVSACSSDDDGTSGSYGYGYYGYGASLDEPRRSGARFIRRV
jgi:hypothetical protein